MRDQCWNFLTHQNRCPYLLSKGVNKAQREIVRFAILVVIEVLRGSVTEVARVEEWRQLLSHRRDDGEGASATIGAYAPLELRKWQRIFPRPSPHHSRYANRCVEVLSQRGYGDTHTHRNTAPPPPPHTHTNEHTQAHTHKHPHMVLTFGTPSSKQS